VRKEVITGKRRLHPFCWTSRDPYVGVTWTSHAMHGHQPPDVRLWGSSVQLDFTMCASLNCILSDRVCFWVARGLEACLLPPEYTFPNVTSLGVPAIICVKFYWLIIHPGINITFQANSGYFVLVPLVFIMFRQSSYSEASLLQQKCSTWYNSC